jgi:leader peptidase (prepilin peptidase)/N-methyltransferase
LNDASVAIAAVLGLVFGSFVGVLVARVPAGEDVVRGRSRCDACGRTLGFPDLVPVLSWVVLRGRCRTCGAAVTPLWTVLELASAGLFALATLAAPDVGSAVILAPFLGVLLALTVIDLRTLRLPDAIVFPTAGVAAVAIAVADLLGGEPSIVGGLIGAIAFGGGMWTVYGLANLAYRRRGQRAMGFGDVKLAALIGLVVGSFDLGSVAVSAGATILIGGAVGVVALARGAVRGTALPYGPMLAAGAVVAVAAGPRIFDAYMGLFS